MLVIRSHDPYSNGAKELAESLHIPRLRHHHSRFTPGPRKVIINWGASIMPPELWICKIFNRPEAVGNVTNKLDFFHYFVNDGEPQIRTVPFTVERARVIEWLSQGHTVCARQKLNGSGGEGLILFDHADKFVEAPLWTLYIKKKEEYRVHVVDGEVIAVQRKAVKKDFDGDVDHRIRNISNGYIFAREGVDPPPMVLEQSKLCVSKLGLDFGAVDIIWNEKKQQSFILEVNSAPGLEGSTIDDYTKAFKDLYEKIKSSYLR